MTVDTTFPAPESTRDTPPGAERAAPVPRRRHRAPFGHVVAVHGAVIGLLLVLSIAAWWHVWSGMHAASRITCQCGDVSEALNFLAWTPWAVAHGHNPFLSNALFAGQGG